MRVIGSLVCVGLVAISVAQATKDIAITAVRIEVGDGKSIPVGVVLIHEGKIAAVGESVTIPAEAEVIDGKGGVLYPGFIDAYSTRGLKLPDAPPAGTPPDSRNTAPASMWHANRKGIRSDIIAGKCLDLKDQLKDNYSQGITTALLSSGSGTIRGIASVVNYTDTGDVLVPAAAAELTLRGGGFGGGGGGAPGAVPGYPGSLLGIIALERQILIDAQEDAANPPSKEDPSLANLKLLLAGQIPALFAADTEREIVRSVKLADEFVLRVLIGGGREAYRQIDLLKSRGAPVAVSLDLGIEPSVTPTDGSESPPEVLKERHDLWGERSQNIKKLNEAGIRFAFSTVGTNLTDYLKNVRAVIKTGLPKEAALEAMTRGAATILGIADRTGTIEVGKQANLTLMSADFADERSEVQSVFVEGKRIEVKK